MTLLSAFVKILGDASYKGRLLENSFAGAPASIRRLLHAFAGTIVDWRWEHLEELLEQVIDLIEPMRTYFRPEDTPIDNHELAYNLFINKVSHVGTPFRGRRDIVYYFMFFICFHVCCTYLICGLIITLVFIHSFPKDFREDTSLVQKVTRALQADWLQDFQRCCTWCATRLALRLDGLKGVRDMRTCSRPCPGESGREQCAMTQVLHADAVGRVRGSRGSPWAT